MRDAVARHVDVVLPKAGSPGPFALADGDWLKSLLESAGFQAVAIEPFDQVVTIGEWGTLDQVAEDLTRLWFIGAAIRRDRVEDTSPIIASLEEALAPFATTRGIRLGASAWIVAARRD